MPQTTAPYGNETAADRTAGERLAIGLGWASIGLAVAAAVALARARREASPTRSRPRRPARRGDGIRFTKAFTINQQPDVVYGFWRKLENLPRFMRHLQSVEVLDDRRSRWRARAPAGMSVSWEAEIVEDQPNERLAWRAVEGSMIPNRGSVRFVPAPGARGTEVHVDLEYAVPGGRLTSLLAKLFGEEPEQQVSDDLRRLKQLLEAGEIASSGAPAGLRSPAQPAPRPEHARVAGKGARR